MSTITAVSQTESAPPERKGGDRRAHVRLSGPNLPSIRTSRLKQGPPVSLIDLSVGGALLEAEVQLKPGTSMSLVLVPTGDAPSIVPVRVLRCEVATVRPGATVYRGACEFAQPLEWPTLLADPMAPVASAAQPIRLDVSLKQLAERCRVGSPDGTLKPAQVLAVRAVLTSLQSRAMQLDDELARPIAGLLPLIATALERRDPGEAVLAEIEAQLRVALPRVDIQLAPTALPAKSGTESIIFRPEQATDLACVLNVQLPAGTTLTDWQFRLLKASMHLCSVIDAAGIRTSHNAVAATHWQKIVVRYKDGRLVKGFSHDFNPGRSQFAIWPSINAAEDQGIQVPLSGLKAVFFVRDFRGDADYVEDPTFEQAARGRRLEVTFFDDEVLVGTTLSYCPDGQGFFLSPADPRVNNLRVFVITSAVRHVRFLGTTTEAPAERALALAGGLSEKGAIRT